MGLQRRTTLTITALLATAVLATTLVLIWQVDQAVSASFYATMTGTVSPSGPAGGAPQLTLSTAAMQAAVRQRLEVAAVAVTVAVLLVGLIASSLLARHILRPVAALTTAATAVETNLTELAVATTAVARGDLTADVAIHLQPLPVESRDELGGLATVFNDAMRELEQTGESFEQMVASLRELVGRVTS